MSKSLSLCSISSTASLFRGSPIPLRSTTHCVVRWFVRHCRLIFESRVLLMSHDTFLRVCCWLLSLSCTRASPRSCLLLLTVFFFFVLFVFAAVFHLTWICASWLAGTPRLRHVRKDRPVYMSGGAFLLENISLVLPARLASPSRLPFSIVLRESRFFVWILFALRLRPSCSWGKDWNWSAPPWNLSPHAPGDLGNLIDDLHLRNLHDFLQFGCSEHLRVHLRIFTAFVWLLDLFLLHNWDFNYSQWTSAVYYASCVAGTLRYKNRVGTRAVSTCTATGTSTNSSFRCTCAPSTVLCTVRTDLRMFTELLTTLSMFCSLITPPGLSGTAWTVEFCLCNTTGTSPCQCAASPGSRCVWRAFWFTSLHLHGVQDLHDQIDPRTDSFLCTAILMIICCSTFTVWTMCLVICLISHSGPLNYLSASFVEDFGWACTFTTCSMIRCWNLSWIM